MYAKALLTVLALACAAGLAAEEAAALKASGTSVPRYGAATAGIVCGDRLCSEPAREDPAPAEEPEEYGHHDPVLRELEPNVYMYFAGHYSSIIVVSDDGVLVTDPSNDGRAKMLKEAVASITDAPVTHVVLSHEHYDHAGGTSVFEDALVVCHVNCQPIFDLDPFGVSPEVDLTFTDYMEIDVGGTAVELHFLAPGDGDATTVVYLPEEQVVFTTDLYEHRALTDGMFLDDSNSTGRQKILNTVSEWPLRHAVTGHSIETEPESLYENAAFLNDLRDAVIELVSDSDKEGLAALADAYANPGAVRLPQYSDWGGYDEHLDRHVQRMLMALYHGD